MSLSKNHNQLVKALIEYVKDEFGKYGDLVIYTDSSDSYLGESIPKIGNSLPDLYAHCNKEDLIIIGEAKTVNDVENRHSLEQYINYLEFCTKQNNAILIFAVPWTRVACLKNRINNLKKRFCISNIDPIYLEPLPE